MQSAASRAPRLCLQPAPMHRGSGPSAPRVQSRPWARRGVESLLIVIKSCLAERAHLALSGLTAGVLCARECSSCTVSGRPRAQRVPVGEG